MASTKTFTFEDLRRILVDRVGLNDADVVDDPNASFEDMGLDSLAFVEVQLAMQQEYGFEIPDEDAEHITSVGEAIEYVNRKLSEEE
ncbi:MAG: acyl carrier protein [Thermoleophilaceae bacterium]|nr:acyl carrier protein [Thermoleophilaceae bacterium]